MRKIKGYNTPTETPLQIIKVKYSKETHVYNVFTGHTFDVCKDGNDWKVIQHLQLNDREWPNTYATKQWAILAIHAYETKLNLNRPLPYDVRQYDLMRHYGPSK